MFSRLAGLCLLAISVSAHARPPELLQIDRDFLKPGSEIAYRRVEADAARACAELRCPHPYLTIESLTGKGKEVWFINGYASQAEEKKVADEYARNRPALAALGGIVGRKNGLVLQPRSVFAAYRPELGQGIQWTMGQGRFLVVRMTKRAWRGAGTVFQAANGFKFIMIPANTRSDAAKLATKAGAGARIFMVRPELSLPSDQWIAADPQFWQQGQVSDP